MAFSETMTSRERVVAARLENVLEIPRAVRNGCEDHYVESAGEPLRKQ